MTDDKKKLHLCNWKDVCKPNKVGGLGHWHAKDSNLTFLSKLGWGLIHHKDELWVKVLWI